MPFVDDLETPSQNENPDISSLKDGTKKKK